MEVRASWAEDRLSLKLALNQMEQELDQCQADLRVERDRRSGIAGVGTEGDRERIQRLYGKYLRADSYRKALVYQKKYLLLLLGGFQDCEQTTLALIARMGVYPSPEDLQQGTRSRRPVTSFRSAARVVVAITRMRYLVRKWKRATSVGSPLMGGTVDLQQGYAPNSNSFSPPCINTQSHMNGSGPFNSHASSPLHSSVHQSPYSPSYLSSIFTQRHLLNGASPYHSQGGASSGYAPNCNSFSPPCINTQSHLNGSGPFNSHASSPLHSSVHQSPYSPSYLSSSFTQRDLLNGAFSYYSLGGASSGYHVNSNEVTNAISYQSLGEVLMVTMSTAISLSIPHRPRGTIAANYTPLLKPQVLEGKYSPLLLPTKVGHSSLIHRVRIRKASSHDDYMSRLDS